MGFVGGGSEIADGSISSDKLAANVLGPIHKSIGLNGLNILDLTAKANLTAGTNANFERDIYTDSEGYLGTIDGENTTATHEKATEIYNAENPPTSWGSFTINCNALAKGYISSIGTRINNNGTYVTIKIIQYGITIFSEVKDFNSQYTNNTVNLEIENYIKPLEKGPFQIQLDDSTIGYVSNQSFSGEFFEFTNQNSIASGKNDKIIFTAIKDGAYTNNGSNALIQTNEQTLNEAPTKFMIVSNEETSGTGSVTYDISFDSGLNYQTDLESFTEYEISDTGTGMILKQNLNAGASEGIANAYNYGVLVW